jgi:hypothetical protein
MDSSTPEYDFSHAGPLESRDVSGDGFVEEVGSAAQVSF